MDLQVKYLPESGVVLLTTVGAITVEGTRTLIAAGIRAAGEYCTPRLLVDHRASELELDTFDIYDLPAVERRLGTPIEIRVALVVSTDAKSLADFRFLDTRSHNAGLVRRVFVDYDAALAWLAELRLVD